MRQAVQLHLQIGGSSGIMRDETDGESSASIELVINHNGTSQKKKKREKIRLIPMSLYRDHEPRTQQVGFNSVSLLTWTSSMPEIYTRKLVEEM